MKLTKQDLVQLIKEELEAHDINALITGMEQVMAPIEDLLNQQIDATRDVDLSLDYLTSAMTGEEAHLMKQFQAAMGRGAARGAPGMILPSGGSGPEES